MANPGLFSISRGLQNNLSQQSFHDGFMYFTTDTHRLYIDYDPSAADGATAVVGTNRFQVQVGEADHAANATTADKIKTTTGAGSDLRPIYLGNDGLFYPCSNSDTLQLKAEAAEKADALKLTAAVGGNLKFIYFNANGTPVVSTGNMGSADEPIYLSNGEFKKCGSIKATSPAARKLVDADDKNLSAGNQNKPVYFVEGVPSACVDYVELTAKDALKLVAQTGATSGYTVGGSTTAPVYFDNGIPKVCTKLNIDTTGNAATSDVADKALYADKLADTVDAGNANVPVYFADGLPAICDMNFALVKGSTVADPDANSNDAAIANTKWVNSVINSKFNANNAMQFKGSISAEKDLPTTYQAGWTYMVQTAGTYVGEAAENGDLVIAIVDRTTAASSPIAAEWTVVQTNITGAVTVDNGSAGNQNLPVYVVDGVAKVCSNVLDVSATTLSNAAGTKYTVGTTAQPIVYFSNGIPTHYTGTKGSDAKPIWINAGEIVECKGPLSVKASTAGTADEAKKLTSNAGSSEKPIYFAEGVPAACGNYLDVITKGARTLVNSSDTKYTTSATKPVRFNNGVPEELNSISVNTTGKANTAGTADVALVANKLDEDLDSGNENLPVYFDGGAPKTISGLDVSGDIKTAKDISGKNLSISQNATIAGSITGKLVYGAVWNDYAEFREGTSKIEAGRIVYEVGDDTVALTDRRMMPAVSAVSDTFGFAIGETELAKTPLAVAGRVLVYTDEDRNAFKAGDVVCSGPNGTVSKMTREEIRNYPECILGVVSAIPSYKTWGEADVEVNGRIWVTIK